MTFVKAQVRAANLAAGLRNCEGEVTALRAELERLKQELRIARFDADVPIRELREENERLRRENDGLRELNARLVQVEKDAASTEAARRRRGA